MIPHPINHPPSDDMTVDIMNRMIMNMKNSIHPTTNTTSTIIIIHNPIMIVDISLLTVMMMLLREQHLMTIVVK